MKVLVTGATGPFGRAVCRRLAAAGHDVTAMARRKPSSLAEGVDFAQGDVRDLATVRAAMQGCSAVVHLAWVVAPLKTEAETAAINLDGTQNVLDAMAETGCGRMIFSSSVRPSRLPRPRPRRRPRLARLGRCPTRPKEGGTSTQGSTIHRRHCRTAAQATGKVVKKEVVVRVDGDTDR